MWLGVGGDTQTDEVGQTHRTGDLVCPASEAERSALSALGATAWVSLLGVQLRLWSLPSR